MDERFYWLGFSLFPGVGPKKFRDLLSYFQTARQAWEGSEKELLAILGPVLSEKFFTFRSNCDLERKYQELEKSQTSFLILEDSSYPRLLKESANPPFVLFMKGSFDMQSLNDNASIGIVGTRKITSYGRQVTAMISRELVDAGCIIVSGLALGVDAVAHQTTIDSGGKTIAVLGCGIECCHPASHQKLYTDIIISGGAIVSEFPFTQSPTKGSFPSRNRIIAGLSHGVVVTEGAEDSGALITAEDAFRYQRNVFAVPGPITSSLSKGPHQLLSKGAMMVTGGQDVLRALDITPTGSVLDTTRSAPIGGTKEEQKIIDALKNEKLLFDDIVRKIGMDSSKVGTLLSMMELKGMIKNIGGSTYSLVE